MIRYWGRVAMRRVSLAIGVLSLCGFLSIGAIAASDIGFRDTMFSDSTRERTVPVAIWYPTQDQDAPFTYGGVFPGRAARDGAIAPGRHPLALISHGTGGNRFNQFHIAEFLAGNGYFVASIEHPGDRTFDTGDFGTTKNLYNRSRDISFVIDMVLADDALASHVDEQRIVALGHSAGGFTAIVAAGGRPNLQNLLEYCHQHSGDSLTCPKDVGEDRDQDPLYIEFITGDVNLKDSRLRAVVVNAPAIGPLFDAPGLSDVTIPVLVFWAGRDGILNEPVNTQFYLDGLSNATDRPMPNIGHFTFLSVCSDMLRNVARQICVDPEGVDRAAVHRTIEAETLDFLEHHVGN